jgi:hypothetical protein
MSCATKACIAPGHRHAEDESEAATYADVAARVRAELLASCAGVSDEAANATDTVVQSNAHQ